MSADPESLMDRLDHRFRSNEILVRALTHKSRIFEGGGEANARSDNEQLEFLGDSVLGFLVSEALVEQFPDSPEGRLSKLKAHLVSASHLHEVAQNLGLGSYLLLGRGEELSGGREKKALLANAIEAVIAALYLDGGIETARRFVLHHVIRDFQTGESPDDIALTDFKSALQEMAQSLHLPQPRYVIVRERGPEHAKTFTVEVRVGKDFAVQAEGVSKKEAGQRAAEMLMQQLTASPERQ